MVSRRQKLVSAAAVLAVGLSLALAFRRSDERAVIGVAPLGPTVAAGSGDVAPLAWQPAAHPAMLEGQHSPQPLVPAQLTGLGAAPATAIAPPALPAVPVTPSTTTLPAADLDARPVYAPIDGLRDSPPAADSPYLVHVVQNGDSLEQLAERYLGDGARALELFDVNRDVLENPHLLPLGAELRIPRAAAARE